MWPIHLFLLATSLCLLHLPSALAIICASLKGGWGVLFAPNGWVRVIQLPESVVVRSGIRSRFSLSLRPDQLLTVGCGVAISSPQILSLPLPAFLKKGGMVTISRQKIYVSYLYQALVVVSVRSVCWLQMYWVQS